VGKEAQKTEAQYHPDWVGVEAAGRWGESQASYSVGINRGIYNVISKSTYK